MMGFRFIKTEPTTYVFQYRRGKLVRQGAGMSFIYFAPVTSLVSVPMASSDAPFMFNEITGDYQTVTVQGQISYRVADPAKIASMMDFTLDAQSKTYNTDDPQKLQQRVITQVQVLMRDGIRRLTLREVIKASDALRQELKAALTDCSVLTSLGVEMLDLSIVAIRPDPETSRALEAEVRESLMKMADEAIYDRRNSAIEQERAIKENELNTEIAVENKKRQIRETQIEAERVFQQRQRVIREEAMAGNISLEQQNNELATLKAENARTEADANAYALSVMVDAVGRLDPRALIALTTTGMDSGQLMAMSFMQLAENAGKIGELNISPDLMRELIKAR